MNDVYLHINRQFSNMDYAIHHENIKENYIKFALNNTFWTRHNIHFNVDRKYQKLRKKFYPQTYLSFLLLSM